jgi:carbamoyl-phosphate synthase large subunit
LLIAQAMREGISVEEVASITKYDKWFLEQIKHALDVEAKVRKEGLPKDRENFFNLKRMGFSDKRLGKLSGLTEKEVRELRCALGVNPSYKRVDSCAAEFDSVTSYMYSSYES